jgi:hypothetical protein
LLSYQFSGSGNARRLIALTHAVEDKDVEEMHGS